MKENISALQIMQIVVSGVSSLRAGSIVLPQNGSVGFANRENIFAIGSTDQDQTIFFR
jgi:hypothetical protein